MANGLRTLNNYTNSYPTINSLSGTAVWNTSYYLGNISSLSFTIPSYNVGNGQQEIRIAFGATSAFSVSINTSSFSKVYGLADLLIEAYHEYEISIMPLNSSTVTIIWKNLGIRSDLLPTPIDAYNHIWYMPWVADQMCSVFGQYGMPYDHYSNPIYVNLKGLQAGSTANQPDVLTGGYVYSHTVYNYSTNVYVNTFYYNINGTDTDLSNWSDYWIIDWISPAQEILMLEYLNNCATAYPASYSSGTTMISQWFTPSYRHSTTFNFTSSNTSCTGISHSTSSNLINTNYTGIGTVSKANTYSSSVLAGSYRWTAKNYATVVTNQALNMYDHALARLYLHANYLMPEQQDDLHNHYVWDVYDIAESGGYEISVATTATTTGGATTTQMQIWQNVTCNASTGAISGSGQSIYVQKRYWGNSASYYPYCYNQTDGKWYKWASYYSASYLVSSVLNITYIQGTGYFGIEITDDPSAHTEDSYQIISERTSSYGLCGYWYKLRSAPS